MIVTERAECRQFDLDNLTVTVRIRFRDEVTAKFTIGMLEELGELRFVLPDTGALDPVKPKQE